MIVLSTLFALLSLFAMPFAALFSGPAPMAPIHLGPTTPTGRILYEIPTPEPILTAEMEKAYQATFFESFEEAVNYCGSPSDDPSSISGTSTVGTAAATETMEDNENANSCHGDDISCLTKKLAIAIPRRLLLIGGHIVKSTIKLIADAILIAVKAIYAVITAILRGIFNITIYTIKALFQGLKATGLAMLNGASQCARNTLTAAKTISLNMLVSSTQWAHKAFTACKNWAWSTITSAPSNLASFASATFSGLRVLLTSASDPLPVETEQVTFPCTLSPSLSNNETMKCIAICMKNGNYTTCSIKSSDSKHYESDRDTSSSDGQGVSENQNDFTKQLFLFEFIILVVACVLLLWL